MKKFFFFLIFLLNSFNSTAHIAHYNNYNKIEMEILRDGEVIGYNYYFFKRDGNETLVSNQIKFTVKIFGATIFKIEGYGEEKYIDDKLISFNSKTLQNDKEKFVKLELNKKTDKFDILGSSYNGEASLNNVIGNWWSHNILTANSQISPISGSVKEQVVTFIAKEKIDLYGKTYETERFKLNSKDMSLPKDRRLDFEIWYDKKNNIIRKVTYSRMGDWEYRVKNIE
ncbi:MAG: DUF6134 family protein [Pelagibacteraceae bacterium]